MRVLRVLPKHRCLFLKTRDTELFVLIVSFEGDQVTAQFFNFRLHLADGAGERKRTGSKAVNKPAADDHGGDGQEEAEAWGKLVSAGGFHGSTFLAGGLAGSLFSGVPPSAGLSVALAAVMLRRMTNAPPGSMRLLSWVTSFRFRAESRV